MGGTAATFLISLIPPLPFLLAGCLPLWVGALLAGVSGLPVRPGVLGAGTLAVAALILAAFAGREAFCPGAGRCPAWRVTLAREPKTPVYAALAVAAVLAIGAFVSLDPLALFATPAASPAAPASPSLVPSPAPARPAEMIRAFRSCRCN